METSPSTAGDRAAERLELLFGFTMLVVLVEQSSGVSWSAYIPDRLGFPAGAELFMMCSGFASASIFGRTFVKHGALIGIAHVGYRVWQVYWAAIRLALVLIALAAASDALWKIRTLHAQFDALLDEPGRAILGLLTLTWQPAPLAMLSTYLVSVALVPGMVLARTLHPVLPFVLSVALYGLGWSLGLNFPGDPSTGRGWLLNPFAWQIVFFISFFIGVNWLPVPRLGNATLMSGCGLLILASMCLSLGFAPQHKFEARVLRNVLFGATEQAYLLPLRIVLLLATAYLAVSLVERWRQTLMGGICGMLVVIGQEPLASLLASIALGESAAILAEAANRSKIVVAGLTMVAFVALCCVALAVRWFRLSLWKTFASASPEHRPASETPDNECPQCALVRNAN